MAYSTAVLERVRNPQRVGARPDDAEDVGSGTAGDLDRGTRVRLWVRVEGERIAAARLQVFGCSAAIAAAALVAERLEGPRSTARRTSGHRASSTRWRCRPSGHTWRRSP
ncbi:MAG: iron-sulfur cluster assembly scaffold protein [Vicinamibacterales bacterium]